MLAFIFYSNYFLFNQIIIFSHDVIGLNFPVLLQAKRNFLEGHLGLWNANILLGVSSFASSNTPIFSPDNWLLFFFSEKYFFLATTYFSFLKLWFIGMVSYHIFYEEFKSRKWAFFSSVIYQLSGFTIWATLILDPLTMFLFVTLSLYIIWTFHRRETYLNFFLLTLALTLNLVSSNVSYTANSLLIICVCAIYRLLTLPSPNRKRFLATLIGSIAISISANMFRLLPIWIEVHNSNRVFQFGVDFRETSLLLLRLFNPEIFSVSLNTSSDIIYRVSHLFSGMHIQWAMPQFFGVFPALLVLWAIISPQKGKINFWTFYVIVTLSLIVFADPFDTIFRIINPVFHTLSMQIYLPLGFAMLAGFSAKNFEESVTTSFSISPKLKMMLIFLLVLIVSYNVVIWAANYQQHIVKIRMGLGAAFVTILLISASYLKWHSLVEKLISTIMISLTIGLLYILLFFDDINGTYASHVKNLSISLLCLALVFFKVTPFNNSLLNFFSKFKSLYFLIGGLTIFSVFTPWSSEILALLNREQNLSLATAGLLKLIIISASFYALLIQANKKDLKRSYIFPIFMAIILADLIPAQKIHSHLVFNPFYDSSTPYPPKKEEISNKIPPIDSKNYRLNFPNTSLQIPLYKNYYGPNNEVMSSMFSIYGFRSYGGHFNTIPKTFEKYVMALTKNPSLGYGLVPNIPEPRFLDLTSVAYHYDAKSHKTVFRPKALSRFMLFYDFEVIPEGDKALERLASPSFNPLQTIVLNKHPSFDPNPNLEAIKILDYMEDGTDKIIIKVSNNKKGLLLFNDTFHMGWNAKINGSDAEILNGNFNFMATIVPKGNNEIIFNFSPRPFIIGSYISIIAALLFFLMSMILFIYSKTFNNLLDKFVLNQ